MSRTARQRSFGRRFRIAAAALTPALALAALVPASGIASAAGTAALTCDQNTIYGIDTNGAVKSIDVTSGAVTDLATFTGAVNGTAVKASNALGVVLGGGSAYAVQENGAAIVEYTAATGTSDVVAAAPAASGQTVIRGAVDPTDDVFYTATNGTSATVGAYDTRTGTEIGTVGTLTGLSGSSGDFAFSTSGQLFVVAGDQIRRVDRATMPTTAGNPTLTTTLLTTLPSGTSSPGIAFSTDGFLYAATSAGRTANASVYRIDPATGVVKATIALGNTSYIPRDLASCNYANTVGSTATITDRVQPGDQFTLTITGKDASGADVTAPGGNAATSSGADSSVTAGPVPAIAGDVYTVTQTAAGTTDPDQYVTTWRCTNLTTGGTVSSGDGATAQFTQPSSSGNPKGKGTDVDCEFTNTPKTVTLELASALGGARIADSDQFTATVGGTSATSSGSGRTVSGGDTGAVTVVVGRAYPLAQVLAAGSDSRYGQYAKTISCTDSGNSGTSLPSGSYDGSATVTPAVGAVIACTVSASAAPASLTAATTLSGARYDDGDQFTAAIRTDPAGNPVGDTSTATTQGSGSTVTSGSGTTTLSPAAAGTAYTVTQTPTADAERYSRTLTCTDAKGFQATTSAPFDGSATVTPVAGAQLSCTVDTAVKGTGLTVSNALTDARFDDADQWTATIGTGGGTVSDPADATTTGSGDTIGSGTGTTGRYATTVGTAYTITDPVSDHAARYAQTVSCVDRNAPAGTAGTTGTLPLTVTAARGADLACTVSTALKKPVVTVTTQLGSERFVTGDQFTTGLVDGNGNDLGTPGSETTAGDGDRVATGSGTTGDATVPVGAVLHVTGAPAAHADRYTGALSCADANHLQGDVTAAAFTGSQPLNPQAGTAYACAVTWTLKPAAITAAVVLGSARSDDGDQWTLAWHTGGASGPTLGSTTTSGTGDTVADGAVGPVAATNAVAYTLTDAASAHGARYATTLSCTDANGKQTGLPHQQAFDGSAVVTPEAGADVRCTLDTALRPAALALQLTAPTSAQVGQSATWTAALANSGGAAAEDRVSFALPDGLDYTGTTGTGWTCAVTGRTVACAGPDLAGGDTDSFGLQLTPAKGSDGTAQLRAAVDPAGAAGQVDPAACTGTDAPTAGCVVTTTAVGSTPHLVLGLTPPAAAAVGAPATWTAVVTNDGTGASGDATVALLLPEGLGSVSAAGADCTVDGRNAVCHVPGPIASAGSASFTITGAPTSGAAGSSAVLAGRVDPAGAAPGDPAQCTATGTPVGCTVAAGATVTSGIALSVAVSAPAQVTEGIPADYTVTVANRGTGPASPAVVAVHLPDGLAYQGATGADCRATGTDLTCTVAGGVPAGSTTSFVVTVVPAAGTAGTVVAPAASVDPAGGTTPPAPAGCSATPAPAGCSTAPGRTVQPAPTAGDLEITGALHVLAPAKAQVVAGDRVRYTFTVVNRTGSAVDHLVVAVPGLGNATCATTTLAAGASTTCALGPVAVTQEQVDAGSAVRTASAAAAPAGCTATCTPRTSNTVTLSAPVRAVARIAAVQTAHLVDRNGDGVAQLNERVDFTVRVTNTGTTTLHGVHLSDALVRLTCPSTTLAVGASMVCTGSRITTAADVAAGGIRNVATASARGVAKLGTVSSERTVGAIAASGTATALAHTGSSLPAGLLGGLSLLAAGAILLVAMRRRRRQDA